MEDPVDQTYEDVVTGVEVLDGTIIFRRKDGSTTTFSSSSLSESEKIYWQDKAALLDPNAYEFVQGANLTRTVPSGEQWYSLGQYKTKLGTTSEEFHQRVAHIDQAIPIPSGTVITLLSNAWSYILLCKPQLVIESDERYTDDPKGLYFERMSRLRTLEIFDLVASIGIATPPPIAEATFPTDFTDGIIVGASIYLGAWLALYDSGFNLLDEVSNYRSIRFAQGLMLPFKRVTFPKIGAAGGNTADTNAQASVSGNGAVKYIKLPEDW